MNGPLSIQQRLCAGFSPASLLRPGQASVIPFYSAYAYYKPGDAVCQYQCVAIFQLSPSHPVQALLRVKTQYQPVGQTSDGGAAVFRAHGHADVVRAAGLGHGDFAVFDLDGVGAAVVAGKGEGLVPGQVQNRDHPALLDHRHLMFRFLGPEEPEAETQAQDQGDGNEPHPI